MRRNNKNAGKKRRAASKKPARVKHPAPVVEVPPPKKKRGVFVPPSFTLSSDGTPVVVTGERGTAIVSHKVIGTPSRVFVPETFGAPHEDDVAREYRAQSVADGFDASGWNCVYGCNGKMSVMGRVRPPLAMHDVTCKYWDTPEGIKAMRALERQLD